MEKEFSIQKLKGSENYHTWQFAIKNLLALKGLEKCVNRIVVPATLVEREHTACEEKDPDKCSRAKATLILSVEPTIYVHINKCTTAMEVWECLRKLYEDRGLTRKIALLAQLILPRLEECDNMQEYIDKKISASNKLTGIGFEVNDEWLGCILLAGLTEEYRPMLMSLESSGQDISADFIVSKLIDVQASSSQKSGEAFLAKKIFKNGRKKGKGKKTRKCFICKSTQHLANTCPDKKPTESAETDKNEKRGNAKENAQNAFCVQSVGLYTVTDKNDWYVDSGATAPMSPYADVISEHKNALVSVGSMKRIKT